MFELEYRLVVRPNSFLVALVNRWPLLQVELKDKHIRFEQWEELNAHFKELSHVLGEDVG